ncbi:hypothetical protein ACIQU6_41610 [Streptomyces sp. NPDC090442]
MTTAEQCAEDYRRAAPSRTEGADGDQVARAGAAESAETERGRDRG